MRVLFAVNNDDISNAILKKYQKDYKEILSYKNVYYFNAILKELQKDKTYDRVVISEDLEPFANNNYDAIDKFLFEKLDNISDEAINEEGNDTDIIFICSDRRSKSDNMLSKLFSIGIYSAIIGQDRSTDEVCRLINTPRSKKEAKQYYKIEIDSMDYDSENQDSVSETEVQNIVAHYKRLERFGKNEDKYIDSFNNIVSQYNDAQLKIIIRYLPISVKAVLEEKSPKYQQLTAFNTTNQTIKKTSYNTKKESYKKADPIQVEMLKNESNKNKITKPIVIPSEVNKNQVKKLIKPVVKPQEDIKQNTEEELIQMNDELNFDELDKTIENIEPIKRGRGRPRKVVPEGQQKEEKPKRGRGRPRKNPLPEEVQEEQKDDELIDLFNIDEIQEENKPEDTVENDIDLFDLDVEDNETENDIEDSIDLFGLEEDSSTQQDVEESNKNEEINLFDLDTEKEEINEVSSSEEEPIELFESDERLQQEEKNDIEKVQYNPIEPVNLATTLTKDKKIVSFVGTTKNGTSFIVNNAAHLLASMGISTAILDMTKTRNAYYIYTNSEEQLMQTAKESINKLRSGIAEGVRVNKNLTVYTSLPEDDNEYIDVDNILATLVKNYSVVLIDCDFDTPMEYFGASQEIYLVQSMDVLTIQPLTAFLRNMQSKGVLRQEKLKIVINKSVNIRSVPIKTLIGGISKYNDPSMSYMKDLFDKDMVPYCVIPFEVQNYIKYLDAVITCTISLNGYSKSFMAALKQLCNMIYPLINKQTYSPRGDKYKDTFSNEMNDTLNKMKRKYN